MSIGHTHKEIRYMVEENHDQSVVYNGNELREDDCVLENIEKTSSIIIKSRVKG